MMISNSLCRFANVVNNSIAPICVNFAKLLLATVHSFVLRVVLTHRNDNNQCFMAIAMWVTLKHLYPVNLEIVISLVAMATGAACWCNREFCYI